MKTTFNQQEFDRLNNLYENGLLTIESNEQEFRKFNQLYVEYVDQLTYKHKKLPNGFLKQFETGEIVEIPTDLGEIRKYQINEYRGIIICHCITKASYIDNNYYKACFKGDPTYKTISFWRFYLDKYDLIADQSISGSLSEVIKLIDEALYWKNDNLPYGTLFVNYNDKLPFEKSSIKYFDNLFDALCKNGFIVENHRNKIGNATENDIKIMQNRFVMPLGKIYFKQIHDNLWKDGNIYNLIKIQFRKHPFLYKTNKISSEKDLYNAWQEFYNNIVKIDPDLFTDKPGAIDKILNTFLVFLEDFYS